MKLFFRVIVGILLLGFLFYFGKPKVGTLFYNQGSDHYKKGAYSQAIDSFQKALFWEPKSAVIQHALASAYYKSGMDEKAIEEYEKTINLDENFIDAYYKLGEIYFRRQAYAEALNISNKATSIAAASV